LRDVIYGLNQVGNPGQFDGAIDQLYEWTDMELGLGTKILTISH
jgi:hypothetical protein